MNKVLIIGPRYFNFQEATQHAFQSLGWETCLLPYDNPIHPYTTLMKCRYKISRNRDKLQNVSRRCFNAEVLDTFNSYKPDLVFIMNGEILFTDTLDYFRHNLAKVAVWLFDSRERLPLSICHIDHVDAMLCYEQEDVHIYKGESKIAYFMPQACDTCIYRPINLMRDIDVLFVGNMVYSPKRQSVTKELIEHYPELNIQIYGLYKPWYKGLIRCLLREYKSIYKNKVVPPEKVNELYNRAKIVLNIHDEQQRNGANPRVFEICGSKAYQICDANPYIESLFPNGEIGIYHNIDEMYSLIDFALSHDMSDKAEQAYNIIMENHTFTKRIARMLELLELK